MLCEPLPASFLKFLPDPFLRTFEKPPVHYTVKTLFLYVITPARGSICLPSHGSEGRFSQPLTFLFLSHQASGGLSLPEDFFYGPSSTFSSSSFPRLKSSFCAVADLTEFGGRELRSDGVCDNAWWVPASGYCARAGRSSPGFQFPLAIELCETVSPSVPEAAVCKVGVRVSGPKRL